MNAPIRPQMIQTLSIPAHPACLTLLSPHRRAAVMLSFLLLLASLPTKGG